MRSPPPSPMRSSPPRPMRSPPSRMRSPPLSPLRSPRRTPSPPSPIPDPIRGLHPSMTSSTPAKSTSPSSAGASLHAAPAQAALPAIPTTEPPSAPPAVTSVVSSDSTSASAQGTVTLPPAPPSSTLPTSVPGAKKSKARKPKRKARGSDEEPSRNVKRRKGEAAELRASGDASSELPAWLVSALGMLKSQELGSEWTALVKAWEAFEVGEGFAAPLNLSPTGRPPCISDWIKRARAPSYRPAIPSPEGFASLFTEWWRSVQPEWRRSASGGSLARGSGDLGSVRKPGVNGLLSAIAALFFWGSAPGLTATGRDAWLEAVGEVSWTVQHLNEARAQG